MRVKSIGKNSTELKGCVLFLAVQHSPTHISKASWDMMSHDREGYQKTLWNLTHLHLKQLCETPPNQCSSIFYSYDGDLPYVEFYLVNTGM